MCLANQKVDVAHLHSRQDKSSWFQSDCGGPNRKYFLNVCSNYSSTNFVAIRSCVRIFSKGVKQQRYKISDSREFAEKIECASRLGATTCDNSTFGGISVKSKSNGITNYPFSCDQKENFSLSGQHRTIRRRANNSFKCILSVVADKSTSLTTDV